MFTTKGFFFCKAYQIAPYFKDLALQKKMYNYFSNNLKTKALSTVITFLCRYFGLGHLKKILSAQFIVPFSTALKMRCLNLGTSVINKSSQLTLNTSTVNNPYLLGKVRMVYGGGGEEFPTVYNII